MCVCCICANYTHTQENKSKQWYRENDLGQNLHRRMLIRLLSGDWGPKNAAWTANDEVLGVSTGGCFKRAIVEKWVIYGHRISSVYRLISIYRYVSIQSRYLCLPVSISNEYIYIFISNLSILVLSVYLSNYLTY